MGGKLKITALVQLATRARQLREWTRFGIYEGDSARQIDLRRKSESEMREKLASQLDQIAKDQRKLNKFYKEVGFPTLPRKHAVVRYWENKVSRLRKAVNRQPSVGRPAVKRLERKGFEIPGSEENAKPQKRGRSHKANSQTGTKLSHGQDR